MKVKYLTLIGTALILTTTCKIAVAESSSTDVKLSPQAKTLLCKEFPLNSRCSSTSTSASNNSTSKAPDAAQTTSPGNKAPGGTTPSDPATPATTSIERETTGTNGRNGTTSTGKNPPGNSNTTKPGSTTPPVGLPPSPGGQTKPYVTPQ